MPYSASDVRERDFLLRMLLCAPPKAGKTTTAVLTSPGPVYIFNADGKGALDPVALLGGEFLADDITSMKSYDKALAWLKANLVEKEIKTVVFDNITTFGDILEQELKKEGIVDGRQLYPELKNRFMYVIRTLLALPINLVVIGQVENDGNVKGGFGHILSLSGKAKIAIPAMLQDWVWLNVSIDPNTQQILREFLLAPQGNWTKGVRSIRDVSAMDANVAEFIKLAERRGVEPKEELKEEEPKATKKLFKSSRV